MKFFIKRFLLIIIGIFLSLVFLECGLRFTGWTISSYQQYKNNKALRNKSQYTIICLGESTTAGQYPVQLQQILDKKYLNKFSVIDCGIPATRLEYILNLLDVDLNKYKPDIAICMMGINNGFVEYKQTTDIKNIEYIKKSKNVNLKIYNLCLLIKNHIVNLLKKEVFANINTKNQDMYKCAIELKEKGKFKEAIIIFEKLLKKQNDQKTYVWLMETYLELKDYKKCYEMAVSALKTNWDKTEFYYMLFLITKNNNLDEFKFYINKAITEDINIFKSYKKYWIYTQIKNFVTDEQKNLIYNVMFDNSDTQYAVLAIESMEQKDYQEAEKYFNKAEEIRLNFPNTETYDLYKLIIKKLIDNNIKVICMQYPVRSIIPLEEQLKKESYYDKLVCVSNEKLFKKALMKKNYDEIFEDQFAGDFGHCTDLGNTMIAENIINSLERMLNLK